MTTSRFSLFYLPVGTVASTTSDLILELARRYKTPLFTPHVTLLGDLHLSKDEVMEKTAELARQLRPFTIQITHLEQGTSYFQCVYIRAASPKLIESNKRARQIFDLKSEPFLPHLSLLYGNLDSEIKESIIQEIGPAFNRSFNVNSIAIWETKEEPKNWNQIKTIPLGSG